ncbi:hypothetical protein P0M11_10125 [Kaistella sp. PBT33-4]|uniref:hypothetical protein n=1 Tax=Kaistella sp. PBT33-4 TaxID=3032000 RepID=UPI0023D7EA9A|nr:hypothetical protein [Kaistella sp. PBT33-4]MDF0720351.1 hypothetical protein [Kaistella sp. PBT33-4]
MMKNINNSKAIFFIMIGGLLTFIIIGKFFDNDMKKNYIYTIGTTYEIKGKSRSSSKRLLFTYALENKLNDAETQFLSDSLDYYKPYIGKRFLVKMNNKQWVNRIFSTYKLYINKPVPDSIRLVPSEGWKELPEWAK